MPLIVKPISAQLVKDADFSEKLTPTVSSTLEIINRSQVFPKIQENAQPGWTL